ncbi:DUF4123 domain-containing protein [Thaumasiovibrio subtropicus]|uniref:DUF4123 domain-containing protein n=1 Tax=Thaumasiovibrio subtropicus TaxID=1891207 RepID=UPI000B34F2FD|nr:DUF4123 domain-containing protein [Thaumasiovibrio subtropicus]
MGIAQLESARLKHWLVVDTINVPALRFHLREAAIHSIVQPLFLGSQFEHLLELGPALIKLDSESHFQTLVSQNQQIRSNAILFAFESSVNEAAIFIHLQQLLYIHINNQPVLFRFYSPQFWLNTNADLLESDKLTILGPARKLIWCDDEETMNAITREASQGGAPRLPYHLNSPVFDSLLT